MRCLHCCRLTADDPSGLCEPCDLAELSRRWDAMTEDEQWSELAEAMGCTRQEAEARMHRTMTNVETMIQQAIAGLPIVAPRGKRGES